MGILFLLSVDVSFRINIGPLYVHPYFLLFPIALVFVGGNNFLLPARFMGPALVFVSIYFLANFRNASPFSEAIKLTAGIITLVYFANATKNLKAFYLLGMTLIISGVFVSGRVLFLANGFSSTLAGVNALEGLGNKNAQSLYTLPGLFFALHFLYDSIRSKRVFPIILLFGTIMVIVVAAIFTANRSGWLGALVVAVSLLYRVGFDFRIVSFLALISVGATFYISNNASEVVEHKVNQTVEGYSSDEKRMDLLRESMLLGIEYPLIGLGQDALHQELANRVKSYGAPQLDTHNMYGTILGGGGVFCFLAFLIFLLRVVNPKRFMLRKKSREVEYLRLYQSLVFLFLIRGFFTREILYNPNFMAALGIGLGMLLSIHRQNQYAVARSKMPTLQTAHQQVT